MPRSQQPRPTMPHSHDLPNLRSPPAVLQHTCAILLSHWPDKSNTSHAFHLFALSMDWSRPAEHFSVEPRRVRTSRCVALCHRRVGGSNASWTCRPRAVADLALWAFHAAGGPG